MQSESDPISTLIESSNVEITFPLVPEETEEMLTEKELFDYKNNRKRFAKWLLREGKDTRDKVGYTQDTAKKTCYRVAFFERYTWTQLDEYIPVMKPDHADDYIEAVAYSDYSQSHKHAILHSVKRYFKWRHHEYEDEQWETCVLATGENLQGGGRGDSFYGIRSGVGRD